MLIFLLGIILIPSNIYTVIFGNEFSQTKKIMLLLAPGIFAIAVSDMIGYYFSGIKELRILNIKAVVGLFITVGFSIYAIPRWGILGACLVTTVSYSASAALLFGKFFRSTQFRMRDYLMSKDDFKSLLSIFARK
jgi:O-antigen/teichoic acid export membrane protein